MIIKWNENISINQINKGKWLRHLKVYSRKGGEKLFLSSIQAVHFNRELYCTIEYKLYAQLQNTVSRNIACASRVAQDL